MKNQIRLYIAGGLAIMFALLFYIKAIDMSESAAFLPKILIGLIIFLSIGTMIEGYHREKKHIVLKKRIDERSDEDEVQEEPAKLNIPRIIVFVIMIATYIFLLKPVGYFIMTPIFALSAHSFLKATKIKNILLIAVGFTVFVYVLFVAFLKIPIPMGILQ